MTGASKLEIESRRALIDAVKTFGVHSQALILVGAQAIYFRTSQIKLAVAPATKDADFALDTRFLFSNPLLESLLVEAGFELDRSINNPGAWLYSNNVPVDFLVPSMMASGGRRSAKIPPHSKSVARLVHGLEGALFDHSVEELALLDSPFEKVRLKVAGEAALLVSKLIKVSDRFESSRFSAKDCHDIYRLLLATPPEYLRLKMQLLLEIEIAKTSSHLAMKVLKDMFAASPDSPGVKAAAGVEVGIGNPELVAMSLWAMSNELIEALDID